MSAAGVPDAVREHFEPIQATFFDIEQASAILRITIEHYEGYMPEEARLQLMFLANLLMDLQQGGKAHINPLWVALGGMA